MELFKNARKTQSLLILQGKLKQNVILCVQFFFKIVLSESNFFIKIVLFKILFFRKIMLFKKLFLFKIWRVVKILIQNLTRRKIFNSKSSFSNLLLQFLAESLSKCYQQPTCWRMAWCKKVFYECVVCVCHTFGKIFLVIASFMAIGFLMGVMTISFSLPSDLYKSLWISKSG